MGHVAHVAEMFAQPVAGMAEPGARPFRPMLYLLERATGVAKWVVPVLMIALGLLLWPRRRVSSRCLNI